MHERYERELGERPRQPPLPDDRDGRPLPRRQARRRPVRRLRDRRDRSTPLAGDVAARLDVFDLTGALERIWEVVRGLNRHVEAAAPWQLAKDDARADELDRVLYDLVDGLRAVAVALAAYLPDTSARDPRGAAAAVDDRAGPSVAYGRARAADGIEPAAPLFPRVDEPAPAA